jgi:hypothetical protein
MAVFSKHPILYDQVRTFQTFLWKDMPGARLPDDPSTPEPADWYSAAELDVFRLPSKSFWDVPVLVDGEVIHLLAAHPTPPTFDGPEDRNGLRNADEIRLVADYVTPGAGGYIYDGAGRHGGLPEGARFVVLGDMNADPFDGDSVDSAIRQLLHNPAVDDSLRPASAGGPEQSALQGRANAAHRGDPAFDTADFADTAPGNLRVDYALPSAGGLAPRAAGVFWPQTDDPLFPLVGAFDPALPGGFPSSDHRLVWIDLALAAPSAGAAAPAAASDRASADMGAGSATARGTPGDPLLSAGDVDQDSAVLWARVAVPGEVVFEVSTDPGFAPAATRHVLPVHDPLVPAKLLLGDDVIDAGTRYHWRATDSAGNTAAAVFATPGAAGDAPRGFRLGVSGDWRGELSPYPAISNADERGLDLFVKLGDTIYADYPSPLVPAEQATTLEEYRLKHLEVYSGRAGLDAWNDLQKTTAVLSTIDDHEVTNDFAGAAPVPAGTRRSTAPPRRRWLTTARSSRPACGPSTSTTPSRSADTPRPVRRARPASGTSTATPCTAPTRPPSCSTRAPSATRRCPTPTPPTRPRWPPSSRPAPTRRAPCSAARNSTVSRPTCSTPRRMARSGSSSWCRSRSRTSARPTPPTASKATPPNGRNCSASWATTTSRTSSSSPPTCTAPP